MIPMTYIGLNLIPIIEPVKTLPNPVQKIACTPERFEIELCVLKNKVHHIFSVAFIKCRRSSLYIYSRIVTTEYTTTTSDFRDMENIYNWRQYRLLL